MNKIEMLSKAIEIATIAHAQQEDKNGEAYILHPLRVMMAVQDYDLDVMMAAVLHDTIEDTDITATYLGQFFPVEVVQAVLSVSRHEDEHYKAFINRAAMDPIGRLVKEADILDNLREPFPFEESMRKRYHNALDIIRQSIAEEW